MPIRQDTLSGRRLGPAMRQSRLTHFIFWLLLVIQSAAIGSAQPPDVGQDVAEAFSRAANGAPLRYVAIGGSITQAGEGWIGDWLRQQFPKSQVTSVNSGISGTGSSLGIFRIDRDVIAYQPDLVAIEFCVNDLGLPDAQAIRYMESLVVRLKSLPHPPAIIILEAATRDGVNLSRHRRVAQHYGLLEVDLQTATNEYLATTGESWSMLFGDTVHPNRAGHALYRSVIEKALQPIADEASRGTQIVDNAKTLPSPLSSEPLLLDGRMVPLQGLREPSDRWTSEAAPRADWSRFFQGVLSASEPGAALQIPFRGTAAGVFFAMNKDFGTFYMNVDDDLPTHVATNTRSGFSSTLISTNLTACEHLFTLVLPMPEALGIDGTSVNGPVKLGYLLLAGETKATRETAPQGPFDIDALKNLRFKAVPASAWSWTGPFALEEGKKSVDARQVSARSFLGETGSEPPSPADATEWQAISSEGSTVDLRSLMGTKEPAIAYVKTDITSATGGAAIFSVDVDYYAQIWLNGELILTMDGPHPRPKFLSAKLRPGTNSLIGKVGAGSDGFSIQLKVAESALAHGETDQAKGAKAH